LAVPDIPNILISSNPMKARSVWIVGVAQSFYPPSYTIPEATKT
jgi:hypothetical protein